jgi:hypothetical protein
MKNRGQAKYSALSNIGIPEQYAERFWQERGKKVARMVINRRRQNTGISMKKRFKIKFPVVVV